MAINTKLLNNSYVKFVRTTVDKWNLLTSPDADTLYFVIENGGNEGSLYLGSTLIATSVDAGLNLNQLNDVVLLSSKKDDILAFDGSNWRNVAMSTYQAKTMVGASAEADGEGGLVPIPEAGDNTLYLRGDGEWADPTVAVVESLNTLGETVNSIDGRLKRVVGGDSTKSMREVAADEASKAMASVVDGAPEAFNTLKEIAAWIQGSDDLNNDAADLLLRVNSLDAMVFGTESESGLNTRVETLEESVDQLKDAHNALSQVVGNASMGLVKTVNELTVSVGNHTTQITELYEKLMWNELVEE